MACVPSAPDFQIPISSSVVGVSIIDSTSHIELPLSVFIADSIPGHDQARAPAFSFLIEHPSSGDKLLFDLGLRPDIENLAPAVLDPFWDLIDAGLAEFSVEKDVATILVEAGTDLADINAIIWSHSHLDHVGDPSTFPNSTALVVGPGFYDNFVPGYPTNPDALILESDYEGREIREIDFYDSESALTIGRFPAVDYFGDGSFYLLDTPGHAFGHMTGLARTTPDTFIFLGADTLHHGGSLRPTQYLPLPKTISPSPFSNPAFLPGTSFPGKVLVDEVHPYHARDEPFYQKYTEAADRNVTLVVDSIGRMADFDAREDVFVVFAHDTTLLDVVDFYPKRANGWKEKGWKEDGQWRFLEDFKGALGNRTH